MALSKRVRFEIFKRDGFTCQYCGQRPPDITLEVDHIDPRSKGGSDDELNLLTACFDCNRGKAAKKLTEIHPRPDADLKYLEAQQEIAEAKHYLESRKELDLLNIDIRLHLGLLWIDYLTFWDAPDKIQFNSWLSWSSTEEVEFAIKRAHRKYMSGKLGQTLSETTLRNCVRYVSGILKQRAIERETENKEAVANG